jgi:enamine deaminase RidA (YjgF/YER057c/UK114 family)
VQCAVRGEGGGCALPDRAAFSITTARSARRGFPVSDIAGQVRTALKNVLTVLGEAGARPEHVVRMTWFITDKRAYLAAQREIGEAYREVMGRHFPAMSVLEVSALLEDDANVEIEATAVIPPPLSS